MKEAKVVATIYCSAGNAEVGDMWTETKVFSANDKIENIYLWIKERNHSIITTQLRLTIAQ